MSQLIGDGMQKLFDDAITDKGTRDQFEGRVLAETQEETEIASL